MSDYLCDLDDIKMWTRSPLLARCAFALDVMRGSILHGPQDGTKQTMQAKAMSEPGSKRRVRRFAAFPFANGRAHR